MYTFGFVNYISAGIFWTDSMGFFYLFFSVKARVWLRYCLIVLLLFVLNSFILSNKTKKKKKKKNHGTTHGAVLSLYTLKSKSIFLHFDVLHLDPTIDFFRHQRTNKKQNKTKQNKKPANTQPKKKWNNINETKCLIVLWLNVNDIICLFLSLYA